MERKDILEKFVKTVIYKEPSKYAILCALSYLADRKIETEPCEEGDFCIVANGRKYPAFTFPVMRTTLSAIMWHMRKIANTFSMKKIARAVVSHSMDSVYIIFCRDEQDCAMYRLDVLLQLLEATRPSIAEKVRKSLEKHMARQEVLLYEKEQAREKDETEAEIVEALYKHGYSIKEIAKMLEIPEYAVRRYLRLRGHGRKDVCPSCGLKMVKIFDFYYCPHCGHKVKT